MPDISGLPGLAIGIVLAILLLIVLSGVILRVMWKVAEPNEALIISGRKSRALAEAAPDESLTFKIVTGGGAIVIPGLQTARSLNLNLVETALEVECVTKQGILLKIKGSVIFKIGDTFPEIANAARRFLDQQSIMERQVHSIFSGHLRAIVGNMTVETLIGDREELRKNVREASGVEMSNLGLKIDSMQILDIGDPSGYIANLSAPHIAAAEATARTARAQRDQEATENEQTAAIAVAVAKTAAAKRQAQLKAESDAAQEQSSQAGPLALAEAQQQVTVAETKAAELRAQLRERQLEAEIRRPADAQAYEIKVTADANRDAAIAVAQAEAQTTTLRATADAEATRLTGEAEGDAIKARGLSEVEVIKLRGEAIRANQEAIIGMTVAENLPEIVRAAASPFGEIGTLTVLNGAEGVQGMLASVLSQATTFLPSIMSSLKQGSNPAPQVAGQLDTADKDGDVDDTQ